MKELFKKMNRGCNRVLRCVNGTKGAISLFLAIMLVPILMLVGVLLDAARLNSAVAIFDEALSNASNSTLGTYDEFLKKRFGLLAMSQDTSKLGAGYDAQDFIGETFSFYMEQNGLALPGALEDMTYSAIGVHPLTNKNVMMNQIMEYSKYTVPTKLVAEGLNLENLVNAFTEKLKVATSCLNALTAGVKVEGALLDLDKALNDLIDASTAYETAKTGYDSAYTAFDTVVGEYNGLITSWANTIQQRENDVTTKDGIVTAKRAEKEAEAAKVQAILNQIAALENEKDSQGRPVDNSAKIAKIKEDNETVLKPYYDAEEAYNQAVRDYNAAVSARDQAYIDRDNALRNKRTAVGTKKGEYVSAIDVYAEALKTLCGAIRTAQNAFEATKESVKGVGKALGNVFVETQKQNAQKDIDELKKEKKDYEEKGYKAAAGTVDKQIQDAEKNKLEFENTVEIGKAFQEAEDIKLKTLDSFDEAIFKKYETDMYNSLIALRNAIRDDYKIKDDGSYLTDVTESAHKIYVGFPTTTAEFQQMIEDLFANAVKGQFISTIKAIIGFIKALRKISLFFDLELTSVVDASLYDAVGGLPSKSTWVDENAGVLTEDAALAEHYKTQMEIYGGEADPPEWEDSNNIATDLDGSLDVIDTAGGGDWTAFNFLRKLAELWTAVKTFISKAVAFVKFFTEFAIMTLRDKVFLSGYMVYNTANRTTYQDKGITGEGFTLQPLTVAEKYAFFGAETEYLLFGGKVEAINQTFAFTTLLMMRFMLNVPSLVLNTEVMTMVSDAAAATSFVAALGGPLLFLLYDIVESFMDCIVLVNGEEVPLLKTKVFATSEGIVEFIGKIASIGLDKASKEEIVSSMKDVAGDNIAGNKYPKDYDAALAQYKSENPGLSLEVSEVEEKILDALSLDYSKHLLMVSLVIPTDLLLIRFADIVQMEATVDAKLKGAGSYTFNLNQSYTYVRASGSVKVPNFMQMAENLDLYSSQRVMYKGY